MTRDRDVYVFRGGFWKKFYCRHSRSEGSEDDKFEEETSDVSTKLSDDDDNDGDDDVVDIDSGDDEDEDEELDDDEVDKES